MNTIARKVFQVRGMTDGVTTCELCGREELRGTVQMIEQDLDGNVVRDHYFGTGCAAKAAGWTQREVMRGVKAAERAAREAQAAERAAAQQEADRAYGEYLLATYGTADDSAIMDRLGLRTARKLLEGFDAYRAEQAAAPPAGEQNVIEGVVVEHAGTAEGSTPSNATHPNVAAAREALRGLKPAALTDHHDVTEPTEAERDVRGYMAAPARGPARGRLLARRGPHRPP